MKKGITATSVAIMVVVIIILLGTITTISYNSIQNAKKIVLSLEISNIQEEVDRYVKDSIDSSYPTLGNSYTINLSNVSENAISQFDGEEKSDNNEISVLEVDLTILGIADTTYGKIGVKVWIYKGEILPSKRKNGGVRDVNAKKN